MWARGGREDKTDNDRQRHQESSWDEPTGGNTRKLMERRRLPRAAAASRHASWRRRWKRGHRFRATSRLQCAGWSLDARRVPGSLARGRRASEAVVAHNREENYTLMVRGTPSSDTGKVHTCLKQLNLSQTRSTDWGMSIGVSSRSGEQMQQQARKCSRAPPACTCKRQPPLPGLIARRCGLGDVAAGAPQQ